MVASYLRTIEADRQFFWRNWSYRKENVLPLFYSTFEQRSDGEPRIDYCTVTSHPAQAENSSVDSEFE